jgi:chitodextrinase
MTIKKLKQQRSIQMGVQLAVAALLVTAIAVYGVHQQKPSHAATSTGTFSLTPASGTYQVGSTISVSIMEDSSTDAVSTVQADMTYDPTVLSYQSIDDTGSQFSEVAPAPTVGSGMLSISRGSTASRTGSQKVTTISFTVLKPGNANIAFAASSIIYRTSDFINIFTSSAGGSYVIPVPCTANPSAPTGLTSGSKTNTSVAMNWSASTAGTSCTLTGYQVYRGATKVADLAAGTTSYTDTGLTANTAYSYTVTASDTVSHTSAASNTLAVTTNAPPCATAPSVPGSLSADTSTTTSITINWGASSPSTSCTLTGYQVYRGATKVADLAAGITNFTDTGLTEHTAYSYTVTASDTASNTSAPSSAFSTNTKTTGDVSGDGHVTTLDIAILLKYWNQTVPVNTNGDLNGDGRVTTIDVAILLKNWGK